MAYRDRWEAAIEEMRRVLAAFPMEEERKWGKPTRTPDVSQGEEKAGSVDLISE